MESAAKRYCGINFACHAMGAGFSGAAGAIIGGLDAALNDEDVATGIGVGFLSGAGGYLVGELGSAYGKFGANPEE